MIAKQKAIACLLILTACMLTGCKSGDDQANVEVGSYQIGTESVAAMEQEKGSQLATEEAVYTYTELEDAGSSAKAYAESMTSEENGFKVVDEKYAEAQMPDFSAPEGTVYLSKDTESDETKILVLKVEWSEGQCVVTTDMADKPVETELEGLTHTEAADFINRLSPKTLELDGQSMEEYNVYVADGLTLVNDNPCLRLEVQKNDNPEGTNEYQGTYFLSRDGLQLYKLDPENDTVYELTLD